MNNYKCPKCNSLLNVKSEVGVIHTLTCFECKTNDYVNNGLVIYLELENNILYYYRFCSEKYMIAGNKDSGTCLWNLLNPLCNVDYVDFLNPETFHIDILKIFNKLKNLIVFQ